MFDVVTEIANHPILLSLSLGHFWKAMYTLKNSFLLHVFYVYLNGKQLKT